MKRLLITLAALLVIVPGAFALELQWSVVDQSSVAWDPVAYLVDGTTERISYTIYITDALKDPGKTLMTEVGKTIKTDYTIKFVDRGSYLVGVKSVVEVNANGEWIGVSASPIGWSDDPAVAKDGQVFGIRFYPAPSMVGGLRTK